MNRLWNPASGLTRPRMFTRHHAVVATVLVVAALFAGAVLAGAPGDFDLHWWSVDGGGGTSTGGNYAVSGAAGQPDAAIASGGDYTVRGGFWVVGEGAPTGTVTPTATSEPGATATSTESPTPTSTATATSTGSPPATSTATATSTGSPPATSTATATSTGSPPPTNTPTATGTTSPTTVTVTPTITVTPTGTSTPEERLFLPLVRRSD